MRRHFLEALAVAITNELMNRIALSEGDDFGWWELCAWGEC